MTFNPFTANFDFKGKNLIEASAGTGKTYSIVAIYLRLLIEKNLNPANILTVTFTIDAAEELKERIRKMIISSYKFLTNYSGNIQLTDENLKNYLKSIPKEKAIFKLKEALLFFDEAAIYTIHKFCKRVLSENPINTNSTFEQNFLSDDKELIIDSLYDFYRTWLYNENHLTISYFLNRYNENKLINLVNHYFFSINSVIRHPEDITLDEITFTYNELKELFYQAKKDYIKNGKKAKYKDDFFSQENTLLNDFGNFKIKNSDRRSIENTYPNLVEKYDLLCDKIERHIEHNIFISLVELEKQLNILKTKRNLMTFSDMIRNVYLAIKNNQLNPKKYNELKALLIDEFQDTDFMQVIIFENLFKDKTAFFIGDPKQSIYRFRGADLNAYFYATNKIDEKNRFKLTTCYRSTENLVKNFNTIFMQRNFFQNDKINYYKINVPSKQTLHIIKNNNTKDLSIYLKDTTNMQGILDDVIVEINHLLNNAKIKELSQNSETIRNVTPSDIAIIVPRNKDAEEIRAYFSNYGIKTVLNSTKSVFNTDEAKELYIFFDALENYSSNKKLKTALLTKIFNKKLNEITENTILYYEEQFIEYSKILTNKGIIPLFLHIFKKEKTKIKILMETGGERVFTNYMHILELLQNASKYENLTVENIKKWLSARMMGDIKESEDYELRLESDQNAIKITTIHKSKGLEYPIVFLLFFNDTYKKQYENLFNTIFDTEKNQHIIMPKSLLSEDYLLKEDIAEKARLFYVAVTRGKGKCYIFDYNTKGYKYLDTFLYGADIGEKLPLETKISNVKKLLGNSATIKFIKDTEKSHISISNKNKMDNLIFNPFTGQIKRLYQQTSYSEISHDTFTKTVEIWDDEYVEEDINLKTVLPPGAKTGNMIHKILETIPYNISDNDLKSIISEFIKNYGFDDNALEYTYEMIGNVLNQPILIDGKQFYLKNLNPENRINELEFYITIKNLYNFLVSAQNLFESKNEEIFSKQIETLKKNDLNFKHYIRGFIDLVFEYNNKLYIIDWKTNYLGDNPNDYALKIIKEEIAKNHYYLQILLYQLALHKYLKQLDNNSFKLGEVFYIFTRGFYPKENYGIFRYRLSEAELNGINQ